MLTANHYVDDIAKQKVCKRQHVHNFFFRQQEKTKSWMVCCRVGEIIRHVGFPARTIVPVLKYTGVTVCACIRFACVIRSG